MAKWYYLDNGQQCGPAEPVVLKELAASGRLKPTDKVRREDMAEWHHAGAVKGLFSDAASAAPSASHTATATPPPPITNGSASSASYGNGTNTDANGSGNASSRTAYDHTADKIREQVSKVWVDLRALNFWEEIAPIDASNFQRMLKDPVILAVLVAGISPIMILTLGSPDLQRRAFGILFAFLWGMVFKNYIIRSTVSWKYLRASIFFTGTVGILLPSTLYRIYVPIAESSDPVVSLVGFLFGVGICEELCKIVPVLAYLFWTRRNADPKACILIGVFSGLGFAATENAFTAADAAAQGIDVNQAMNLALVRSLSCVLSHALWTGIFAYFLTVAFLTGRRYIALALVGLAVSAALHGVYDWFCSIQLTLAAAIVGVTFILFYAYLTKLEALAKQTATPVHS
jgi:protease PrsW